MLAACLLRLTSCTKSMCLRSISLLRDLISEAEEDWQSDPQVVVVKAKSNKSCIFIVDEWWSSGYQESTSTTQLLRWFTDFYMSWRKNEDGITLVIYCTCRHCVANRYIAACWIARLIYQSCLDNCTINETLFMFWCFEQKI